MQIETRWSIGDKVWGVCCDWFDPEVPCEACHGEGGANIPGTGVFVQCGHCNGNGQVSKTVHHYYVREETIHSIDVHVSAYRKTPEITYHFMRYIHSMRFHAIAETQEAARAEAKRLADADSEGELSPNDAPITTS